MNGRRRPACAGLLVCILGHLLAATAPFAAHAQGEPAGNEPEEPIQYAEHAPLAPESLLLDSLRAGGRILAAGERGHIVYSDDEGLTWQQAETVPARSTLTTLAAGGERLWAAGHDTAIVVSDDGGLSWSRQFYDPDRLQPIMDLHFFDENRGLAVGAYGLMLVTGNGGATWDEWAVNEEDDYHLNSLIELGDGTLLIAGEAGYSYRSFDQGETWEPLDLPYHGSMFRALDLGGGCVLFVGLRGHAMRSCDRGDTWEEVETDSDSTLIDGVVTNGRALLVGNGGTILERLGPGAFVEHEHRSGDDFSSILALGDGRFLLTGEDGTYFYPERGSDGVAP